MPVVRVVSAPPPNRVLLVWVVARAALVVSVPVVELVTLERAPHPAEVVRQVWAVAGDSPEHQVVLDAQAVPHV